MAQPGRGRVPFRAVSHHDQDSLVVDPRQHALEQRNACRINPVCIFEDKQHRMLAGQRKKLVKQRRQNPLPLLLRRQVRRTVRSRGVDRQQICEDWRIFGQRCIGPAEQTLELLKLPRGSVSGAELRSMLELPHRRIERAARMMRRALVANGSEFDRGNVLLQTSQQPRLADACFT